MRDERKWGERERENRGRGREIKRKLKRMREMQGKSLARRDKSNFIIIN